MNILNKKKVYVGMSGGVDSSVSAALLKDQGYDVTGVFIKVWQPDFMPCSWKEERRDAMRVAAHLDIPFITLDLEKEYKQEVVDYMIREYKQGRTPNPDVMCNRYVKFGGFFDWAIAQGADFVATGHYAQISTTPPPYPRRVSLGGGSTPPQSSPRIRGGGETSLIKGQDDNKDQSYFLWTLTSSKLSKVLFPIGNIEKPEVRRLAKKFKLPNAEKKDSQGLCFVGKVDMKEFLKHFIDEQTGDVLNEDGEIIGHHEGSLFYTLGERHGFVITKKTPDDKPYFVVSKDVEKNTLTVSQKSLESTRVDGHHPLFVVMVQNTNWISSVPVSDKTYQARIRYRGVLHEVNIKTLKENRAEITFKNEEESVASGQSVVVYDGEICVGGGVVA